MMPPVSDPTPTPPSRRPAVFFDRDNTLIVADDYLGDPEKVVLVGGAAACVAGARQLGFAVVVVSNQSGVARGYYTEADVRAVDARLDGLLWAADRAAKVDHHDFCPHHPTHGVAPYRADCDCRKPKDGMLRRSAETLGIDLQRSWCVGDAPRDVEAGKSAGCRTILLSVAGIAPSPAASAEAAVEPDFRAASLAEVLDILKRETGHAAAAESGEGSQTVTEVPAALPTDEPTDAVDNAEPQEPPQTPAESANDADAFDAAFYRGRPPKTEETHAEAPATVAADEVPAELPTTVAEEKAVEGPLATPEPARPKVVIGSKAAAAMSPLAKKAAAAGAGGKTPEELKQSVDERAQRLRERFGAIRSQTAAPAGGDQDAAAEAAGTAAVVASSPPDTALLVKIAADAAASAANTAATAAAKSSTDAAIDRLRRDRDAHADDFSLLRLFGGIAQVLALGAVVWALLGDVNQARLLVAIFLQLLALTFVMGARSGSL